MLKLSSLTSVRAGKTLFDRLSCEVNRGEALYIQGSNGAGKTTLLKIISGLLMPDSGEVLWNGSNIGEALENYRSNMIYVNHQQAYKDELTVQENLYFSLKISGACEDTISMQHALSKVGLSKYNSKPFRLLSQGQKRRLTLARLIADKSRPLWILDEPYNTLDLEGVVLLEGLIESHINSGGSIVLTSHLEPKIDQNFVNVLRLDQ